MSIFDIKNKDAVPCGRFCAQDEVWDRVEEADADHRAWEGRSLSEVHGVLEEVVGGL